MAGLRLDVIAVLVSVTGIPFWSSLIVLVCLLVVFLNVDASQISEKFMGKIAFAILNLH